MNYGNTYVLLFLASRGPLSGSRTERARAAEFNYGTFRQFIRIIFAFYQGELTERRQ